MTGVAGDRSGVERIAAHEYAFTSTWQLPFTAEKVFAVLRDLWSYPEWWPEFKGAQQTAEDEGVFALRSRLPLTLNFTLRRDVEDSQRGILRALATGDIEGVVEWRLQAAGTDTVVGFTERVELQHPLARRTDFMLRPLLTWNHRSAMNSGERGLITHLRDLERGSVPGEPLR